METNQIKVYNKTGNTSYKEKNFIKSIREAIAEKLSKDPNFQFTPANNFEELTALHRELCIDTVEYENLNNSGGNNAGQQSPGEEPNGDGANDGGSDPGLGDPNLDPFNRQEPNIRGYVTADEYGSGNAAEQRAAGGARTFGEPISFEQGFKIPTAEENQQQANNQQGEYANPSPSGAGGPQPVKNTQNTANDGAASVNDPEKRKKNTKRFAKRVVKMALNFLEKGYVWWTTKDINAAALADLEISGDVDFRFMLSLENGQEVGIKQFFAQREKEIIASSKFTEENREDLVEDLTEMLIEKNISPSNGQIFFITLLETVGAKFADAAQEKMQMVGIVTTLKAATQQQRAESPQNYQEEGNFNQFDNSPNTETGNEPGETIPPDNGITNPSDEEKA